eukprot:5453755-Prymnesium_polylepis.1
MRCSRGCRCCRGNPVPAGGAGDAGGTGDAGLPVSRSWAGGCMVDEFCGKGSSGTWVCLPRRILPFCGSGVQLWAAEAGALGGGSLPNAL